MESRQLTNARKKLGVSAGQPGDRSSMVRQENEQGLNRIFYSAIALFLLSELLGLTNLAHAPHHFFSVDPNSHSPFFAFAVAALFAAHLQFHGRQAHVFAAIAIGLILTTLHAALFFSSDYHWLILVSTCCYYLGVASALMLAWLAWRHLGTSAGRSFADTLKTGLLLPVFVAISWSWLEFISVLRPNTFDAVLYRFEDSLGFQASVLANKLFREFSPLADAGFLIYTGLPLFAAVEYGLQCKYAKSSATVLRVFLLIALVGSAIYFVFPAVGPKYFLRELFPNRMPGIEYVATSLTPVDPAYRNAMPSLHMAWAMALWLGARDLPLLARGGYAFLALGTALTTLGFGEHYAIDLVVAVPFALAAHAVCIPGQPVEARRAAIAGTTLTVAWLVYLATGVALFASVGKLHLAVIAITLVASFRLWNRLETKVDGEIGQL
jgi:hypothetical protein